MGFNITSPYMDCVTQKYICASVNLYQCTEHPKPASVVYPKFLDELASGVLAISQSGSLTLWKKEIMQGSFEPQLPMTSSYISDI